MVRDERLRQAMETGRSAVRRRLEQVHQKQQQERQKSNQERANEEAKRALEGQQQRSGQIDRGQDPDPLLRDRDWTRGR